MSRGGLRTARAWAGSLRAWDGAMADGHCWAWHLAGARVVYLLWEVWAGFNFWWNFCWSQCDFSENKRASMWLPAERKWLLQVALIQPLPARASVCVAVACSGVNSRILRSPRRSSEVKTLGHNTLQRGISCPASCWAQWSYFPCFY